MNETFRQYNYALGIANAKGRTDNGIPKSSNPGSPSTVMNISAYQSAQALASQAQGMLSQAKSVIPTNATSSTQAAIAKLAGDLSLTSRAL